MPGKNGSIFSWSWYSLALLDFSSIFLFILVLRPVHEKKTGSKRNNDNDIIALLPNCNQVIAWMIAHSNYTGRNFSFTFAALLSDGKQEEKEKKLEN